MAERTPWKILCDWAQVQLSMILLEKAVQMLVFLPLAWDPATEKAFFDKLKDAWYKALLPCKPLKMNKF